jgi:hypothetical protein
MLKEPAASENLIPTMALAIPTRRHAERGIGSLLEIYRTMKISNFRRHASHGSRPKSIIGWLSTNRSARRL